MEAERQSRHVLFVDDEPVMHRLVEHALRRGGPGLRLTWAGNGAQALSVLERLHIDLLVTALAMPVLDGVELLRHVANRGLAIPIVVTTSHNPPVWPGRSAIRCVREPVHPDSLAELIRERLAGEPGGEAVSVADFARLLTMMGRSGALRAKNGPFEGVLVFSAGVLVDATLGELRGDAAAREILAWPRAVLRIDELVRTGLVTITCDLASLQGDADDMRALQDRGEVEQSLEMPEEEAVTAEELPRPALVIAGSCEPPLWDRPAAQRPIAALLQEALKLPGALGCVLVAWELDHVIGARAAEGQYAAAGQQAVALASANARVMRAIMTTTARLVPVQPVTDAIINIDGQVHLFVPLPQDDRLSLCVVIDAARGNLALARLGIPRLLGEFRLEDEIPQPQPVSDDRRYAGDTGSCAR